MKNFYKYVCLLLITAFLSKAVMSYQGVFHDPSQGKMISVELSKIFGKEVVICAPDDESGSYKAESDILDKNSKNNHASCFDCPYCSGGIADTKILSSTIKLHHNLSYNAIDAININAIITSRTALEAYNSQAPPQYS
jgi:hypothetical protein